MTTERPSPSQLRIGDAERESAVAVLGEHFTAGRITHEEYDDRSTRAYAARTNADLWPLFQDLPPLRPVAVAHPTGSSAAERRGHHRSGPRPGVVLLVVLAVLIFTEARWPLLLLLGWVLWSRSCRSSGPTRGAESQHSQRSIAA